MYIYYLLEGPSPTRYSTTLSITPLSLGITGRGKGGPPLVIPPGGIPDKLDKIYLLQNTDIPRRHYVQVI